MQRGDNRARRPRQDDTDSSDHEGAGYDQVALVVQVFPAYEVCASGGLVAKLDEERIYENSIQEMLNPWGEKHFWIGGGKIYWEHSGDTDMEAIQQGFVSVSPIHLDLTNYNALKFMRETWKISEMLDAKMIED